MGLVFKSFSAPHAKQPGAVNAPNPPFLLGEKRHFALHSVFLCVFFFLNIRSVVLLSSRGVCPLLGWDGVLGNGKKKKNGEKLRGTRQARTGTIRSTGPKQWRIRIACVCLVRVHQYK